LLNHARHLLETTQEMEATLGRLPAVATPIVPRLPAMFQRYPGLSIGW
jgi:hypothetical protein